jgi:hypothetical protein
MTQESDRNPSDGNEGKNRNPSGQQEGSPHSMHLPGFIIEEEIGFGDVVKRTTSYFGIKPCGGCEHRAAALNRWLVFTRRQSR